MQLFRYITTRHAEMTAAFLSGFLLERAIDEVFAEMDKSA